MYNCLNQIIIPNPCLGSTPCKQFYNAACIQYNGTLTCGSFGVNPTLDLILAGFCVAVTNINNEITTIQGQLNGLQTIKVCLTSAQILTLHTTPVVLVPAQGAGTIIQVIGAVMSFTFVSTPYATHTALNIQEGGTGNILNSSFPGSTLINPFSFNVDTILANTAVTLTVPIGNPTAGDGTLCVYITYQVISL